MKVLFVGPYPPPHGGISVHVSSAHARMMQAGQRSSVLNIDPRAPKSDAYIKISGAVDLGQQLVRHVWNDWTLHVHTNGHNAKSWAIALACGIAAQFGPGASLTLHSGIAPAYICGSPVWMRVVIRFACVLYQEIVCVNREIAEAVRSLGVAEEVVRVTPAFLPVQSQEVVVPQQIETWMSEHSPVLSSTMFFRPEYGFDLLLDAMKRLRLRYQRIGCIVMGGGDHRESAARQASKRGLSDVVLLAGDLDHEICLTLMSRSDVFLRPSFRDGDSISVREAIALGVPVVASNVGTRPDGVSLFECGDLNGLVQEILACLRREPGTMSNS